MLPLIAERSGRLLPFLPSVPELAPQRWQVLQLVISLTLTCPSVVVILPVRTLYFEIRVSAERILIGETLAVERDGIPTARRLIPHVENLVARTQILAGIAMAVQTPLHLQ